MNPLITVIVPVYNVEDYLDKCVESIVNQTYKNLEIILVDDGSPDNCPQMCDAWAKKDSRIKVLHKQNSGVSSTRNSGIDACTGEYISFIDSDDWISQNMLEVMLKSILDKDYDVCLCNTCTVDTDNNFISESGNKGLTLKDEKIIQCFLSTDIFDSFSVCDKLYKASIIKENNLYFNNNYSVAEDYLFNYYYFKQINSMIAVEEVFYFYLRKREESATYSVSIQSINRWRVFYSVLINEKQNSFNYNIALSKYAKELMCIVRELLQCKKKNLIDEYYCRITDEIRKNYNDFKRLKDLNNLVRMSLCLINLSPCLFKILYTFFLLLKGRR